ncbi:hypothetical protein BX600DRAFT_476754 [Xylariales sp. PMI_506]|nr:hypothetical protein BX600DRAFT_476754 [Xylariales sp. PMI_506]
MFGSRCPQYQPTCRIYTWGWWFFLGSHIPHTSTNAKSLDLPIGQRPGAPSLSGNGTQGTAFWSWNLGRIRRGGPSIPSFICQAIRDRLPNLAPALHRRGCLRAVRFLVPGSMGPTSSNKFALWRRSGALVRVKFGKFYIDISRMVSPSVPLPRSFRCPLHLVLGGSGQCRGLQVSRAPRRTS